MTLSENVLLSYHQLLLPEGTLPPPTMPLPQFVQVYLMWALIQERNRKEHHKAAHPITHEKHYDFSPLILAFIF